MYTTSVIYAVFTMIRSRPVSCTYCYIINLSITTITLCIAQKMQEAERIFNHHVYNVGDIRCIQDDLTLLTFFIKANGIMSIYDTVCSEDHVQYLIFFLLINRILNQFLISVLSQVTDAQSVCRIGERGSNCPNHCILVIRPNYEFFQVTVTQFHFEMVEKMTDPAFFSVFVQFNSCSLSSKHTTIFKVDSFFFTSGTK